MAFVCVLPCCTPSLTAQATKKPVVAPNFGNLPLSFTANQGQADKSVNFLAKGQGYGLYLTANKAVLALSKPATRAGSTNPQELAHQRMLWPFLNAAQRRRLAKMSAGLPGSDTLRMELRGANREAQVTGSDELPGTTNYFIGNDPTRWRTRVPTFAKVHYTGVYPGIDLIYYGNQRRLEYDFVVAPHANPRQVELHFSGAQQLKLDHDGNLFVIGDNGEVAFEKPVVYQDNKGQRVPVKGRYALLANHTVGFKVGKYDRSKTLVIDPTLSYATYLGGSTDDAGTAIAVDTTGNVYIIGFSVDTDFPVTAGAFQTTNTVDNIVAFVAKLNAAGSALVYATYLGGTGSITHAEGNDAYGIALDNTTGSVYITGETFANDFPVTTGAFQAQNNGFAHEVQNAFVSKLSPDGSALVYSTYLGGSGLDIQGDSYDGDSPLRMAVDGAGSAYIVGTAHSTDFPVTDGAYQGSNKAAANLASNAFVAKLSPNGSSLVYSTYLGGSGVSASSLPNNDEDGEGAGEAGYGIAVDAPGEAYVTGYTFSPDFPVTAAGHQQVNHGTANFAANAFVTKLNATGTGLVGSTYLGGTGRAVGNGNFDLDASDNGDDGIGVALDTLGDAYVVGVSSSTDFPTTTGAYQTTNNAAANLAANAFVSKLDPTLSTLMFSTYVGGSGVASPTTGDTGGGDFGTGIVVDTAGDAYITGATESRDFPVTGDAFQTAPRTTQVVDTGFFTELNPAGSGLQYSTYLGGSGASSYGQTSDSFFDGDFFYDIALDASLNIYLTGYAYSYDFPVTKNALQRVNNAGGEPGGNGFIAKFGATAGITYLPTTATLSSTTVGANVTFTAVVKPVTGTGVPTGTVNFYVNTKKVATVTLDTTGTATYTTTEPSGLLADVISAYFGDATYGASGTSLGLLPTPPVDTAVALVFTTPPAATIGQGGNGGTAIITVIDASGETVTTPTVPVSVTISGPAGYTPQTYPAVTTAGGVATFNFGNYPLTVPGIYSYIATSAGLISTGALETVAPVITSISPNLVAPGGPALTLTLNGNFTGVLNSDIYFACVTSPVSGRTASPFTGSTTAVTTTIPAAFIAASGVFQVYIGTGNCTPVSNSVPLFVANTPAVTTVALTAAPATVPYGKPVTLTATVISATGAPVTPGLVAFCSSESENCGSQFNLGSAQLNAAGVASLPLYPGGVGVHSYLAVFLGTTNTATATSPTASVTVTGTYPTITSLAATGNPGNYTLTGTVVGQGVTTPSPTGSVSFIDQTNSNSTLGTGPLGTLFQGQTFIAASGSPVTAGTAPYSVATGDFNGDGLTDFAVENYGDGTVSVFLGNGDGTFKPQVTYTVGTEPEGIAAADVNGDGKLDLVVTNTGSASISVLLGNGDGTFQAQLVNNVDLSVTGVVVADFNNDGKPDIATSNFYSANVTILLGNGDGTFQQEQTYPVGNQPRTLTFGDFNGDGIIDLAVANQEDNTLSILIGNGDGTFQQQILYPTGTAPQGVAVADFNDDNIPDLAIGNSGDGTVGILLGNGDGTFQAMTTYAAGAGALGPVVADFNGDGNADVAVENFNGATESVLLGNGDGTLAAQTTFPTGTSPYSAAIGDFSGLGLPDLVISNFGSNNETVLLDQVTSTGTAVLLNVAVTGAPGNHNVVATYPGDTNFTPSTSTAIPLMSTGPQLPATTLTLTASPTFTFVGQAVTLTATLAPFNGTGFTTDGETVTFLSGGTAIGTGTLAGGVATLTTGTLPAGANSLTASYPGDVNLAGSVSQPLSYDVTTPATTVTTLVVTAGGTPVTTVASGTAVTLTATVTLNDAPLTPGLVTFCDATAALCENSAVLATAQLTAAGTATLKFIPEIGVHSYKAIFAGTLGNTTSTSPPQPLTVTGLYSTTTILAATGTPGNYTLTGTVQAFAPLTTPTGNLTFTDTTTNVTLGTAALTGLVKGFAAATTLATGRTPYGVGIADFNGDGIPDVAVCNSSDDTVGILLGLGNGTFNAQLTYPEGGPNCNYMAIADVNGDGKPDVIVTNGGDFGVPGTFNVLLGNGDGTFQQPLITYSGGDGGSGVVAGDFNGDGIVDLVITNRWSNTLGVFLGKGDGTFQAAGTLTVGTNPVTSASAGDFNADGKLDLVVSNTSDNTVGVLLGNGDGTFQAQQVFATGAGPTEITIADFNKDGKLDLSVSDSGLNAVSILLGNGDGTFQAHQEYAAGAGPRGQSVADFNGDGQLDLAVANAGGSSVSVLLGNGDGTFQAQQASAVGTSPFELAVADLNGDGAPDIVDTNDLANSASVLLNASILGATLANVAVTGAPGNHNVVATYPGDTNFTTSTSTPVVLVEAALSTPAISSLTPNSALVGSGATVVTIAGAGFITGAAVTVNGTSQAATFVAATQLTTTLTAAQLATAGTLTLVVVNPDGGTSNAATFTVSPQPVSSPTITSLTPNNTYAGSNATVVTIAGTLFVSGAALTVNGTSQAATFVSATQLTTTITAAQLGTAGTLTLVVVNPDGGTSNAAVFTVNPQPIQLAPATLTFGNQTVGTTSAAQAVTVTNTTTTAYNLTAIALILGLNPGDFAQTNNCPATLTGGATCQINITFTPGGVGAKSAGLQVSDNSPVPSQAVNVSGTGTGGILQVNPGNLKTIAGNGTAGYTGDGGPAPAAELNDPDGVEFDALGNLYIADVVNNVIRKVDTSGNITTVAGNGTAGFSGDGGPATAAQLYGPFGVTPDAAGNLYIMDTLNARIRKVDTTGIITTIAGNGTFGFSGDGGPATAAEVAEVQGARFDASGNLFFAQCGPGAIREINTAGIITTVAGNGTDGFSGDGGLATAAQLDCPSGVAIDKTGELFIADYLNYRVRKVNAAGIIATIAGTGAPGFSGDGGAAVAAEINLPNDVDLDSAGDVYIADSGNNRIREIDTTGVITTVAGGLDNAGSAGVNAPSALAFDKAGNLYFSDAGNNAVREVFPAGALAFPSTPLGTAAANLTVTLTNIGNLPVTIASQASFVLTGNSTDFSLAGGSCLQGATLAAAGSCTLAIGFTPTVAGTRTLTVAVTDDAVYSPQSFQISGVGLPPATVVLSSIAPVGATAGAAATTITATGANFSANSVVNFNGAPLVTTFVSTTQVTAVVPAALLTTAATASITVTDPASPAASQPAVFTIVPSGLAVTFTAPTAAPGEQPTLNFGLQQPYPAALTGTMTLTFTPDTGNPNNPQVQLSTAPGTGIVLSADGRTLTFPLAANSTVTPAVLVQIGNVSGTITITLQLTSAGVNVTPVNVVPVTIVVPKVAPTITDLTFSASGTTLTVVVTGYSTTREIQSATFNFTPASGASLLVKTLTVQGSPLFQTWYSTAGSDQYGSAFTYTQIFNLSGNASAVGGIGVTLTNTIGTSTEATAP